MNSSLDNLILRRLCLPANTDLSLLNSGEIKSKLCECGSSHHIACVVDGKWSCFKCPQLRDEHL